MAKSIDALRAIGGMPAAQCAHVNIGSFCALLAC
jgi:hypothetical protein